MTDWRDYDSIYTERYMLTPQENPEGYKVSSVVEAAANLHGRLLIAHGAIDDNVSLRNTMRLVHALQRADKDFELMLYPSSRHGIYGLALHATAARVHQTNAGRPQQRSRQQPTQRDDPSQLVLSSEQTSQEPPCPACAGGAARLARRRRR